MNDLNSRTASADSRKLRIALSAGVSAFAISLFASPAFAQDVTGTVTSGQTEAQVDNQAGASEDDEIVVTGIRASLQRSSDIRREGQGVVDAIVAEDIGKFPDSNLAESLQRIPGISINRVNGEGSEVTARGFGGQFNLVTLNGRQMPASNVVTVGGDQGVDFGRATSRSFDFSNVASEGVSVLEVYKTGRAAVPSGGIGATINILTRRPLDATETGLSGTVGAKALYDSSNDGFNVTPEFSGLLNWVDDEERFGVMIFGAYQYRESAAASATSNDWNIRTYRDFINPANGFVNAQTTITNAPTDLDQLISVPNDSRYHYSESERERINGQLVLQFRPMDNLTLTADAFYAQNRLQEERADQTNWFNRPFREVRFDGNPTVATTIFLQENLSGVKDIGFEQQFRATEDTLESYGFNARWEIVDRLTLNLDGHTSRAKSVPDAPNGASSTLVAFGAPVVAAHSVDYSGAIPVQDWTLNDGIRAGTNPNGVLDLGDLGSQVGRTNASRQEQRVDQVRLDLGWEFDGNSRLDFGANYVDSRMTSERVSTQQTLGDWGITDPGDVQQFAPGLVEQYCLQCQFNHYTPGDAEIAFRGNAVDILEALSAGYSGNPIAITGNDFDEVNEEIWSLYAQFSWNGELAGRPVNLTGGVRYEHTNVDALGLVAEPIALEWRSDNDFSRIVSDNIISVTRSGEYDNVLPAIDFRIEPMDNVVARASYSRTMSRPDYGNLFVSDVANAPNRPTAIGGVATGNAGNPGLLPLVSDNLDIALEWYFAPSSFITATFFNKDVKNFVGVGQFQRNLFGLRDPSSGQPGTRSGTARQELLDLGLDITDVNLFTMTALLIQNGGDINAASTQFQANLSGGVLNQAFVDTVLAQIDIRGDAADPLFEFSVAEPINTEDANIHGIELAAQYFLGDTGFGIAGSYTFVDGDVGIDVGADPNENTFALVGLSDTANLTLIYENYGISARLTYNWRDKFLAQTNRQASRNPVFVAPFATVDLNVSYDVTEQIAVSFEAVNLTGEPIRTYGRDESNLWFAQELSPQFFLGARFRF